MLDVADDNSRVKLELPEVFGRGLKPKWINMKNVKPLQFTRCGKLFVLLPPETMDVTIALLVETATCGDCGIEGDECSLLEGRGAQLVLLEIRENGRVKVPQPKYINFIF